MLAANEKQARASRPFSLNQTGTLSRRHLAHFLSAVDTIARSKAAFLDSANVAHSQRDTNPVADNASQLCYC
jgi:hypothetical protein